MSDLREAVARSVSEEILDDIRRLPPGEELWSDSDEVLEHWLGGTGKSDLRRILSEHKVPAAERKDITLEAIIPLAWEMLPDWCHYSAEDHSDVRDALEDLAQELAEAVTEEQLEANFVDDADSLCRLLEEEHDLAQQVGVIVAEAGYDTRLQSVDKSILECMSRVAERVWELIQADD